MRIIQDAQTIVTDSIRAVLPDVAVREALRDMAAESVHLVAIGKAAWLFSRLAGSKAGWYVSRKTSWFWVRVR